MIKTHTKLIIIAVVSAIITGCNSIAHKDNSINTFEQLLHERLIDNSYHKPFLPEQKPIFVKAIDTKNVILNTTITINSRSITLMAAIKSVMPDLSVITEKGVNTQYAITSISFSGSFGLFLEHLQALTGYGFVLEDNVLRIQRMYIKTYDLATLAQDDIQLQSSATESIGQDGNSAAPKIITESNKDWENIISNIRTIVGDSDTAKILANKRLGRVTVIAPPDIIRNVDTFVLDIKKYANKQIHIQTQVLDVLVDNADGRGINWNLISNQSSQFQIGNKAQTTIDGAGVFSLGSVGGASIDLGKKISLDLMLNLLNKQGKVKINNQPNITLMNGRTAHITTGDEFSYVAAVNATPDDLGNVTTTSDIKRMKVGVDFKVSAKITQDDSISLAIVPVISSLKSFSTITSGNEEFQTPNIALQQLATIVQVKSGETLHLGGLIAEKVANASRGFGKDSVLGSLFNGMKETLEKREIVLLVTPTIVN